jgi:hypothetical protein
MSYGPFIQFEKTKLGQELSEIIRKPDRIPVYEYFVKLEMPSVLALVPYVRDIFRKLEEGELRTARQFCGVLVGDILKERGYVQKEKGVSARFGGEVFKTGTVWQPAGEAR